MIIYTHEAINGVTCSGSFIRRLRVLLRRPVRRHDWCDPDALSGRPFRGWIPHGPLAGHAGVVALFSSGARVCDPQRVESKTNVGTNFRVPMPSTRCGSQSRAPGQYADTPAGGVKTPWQSHHSALYFHHEFITSFIGAAPLVRRRRLLFWRSGHWWQRNWPDSGGLPARLCHGRIPHEKLTGVARKRRPDLDIWARGGLAEWEGAFNST